MVEDAALFWAGGEVEVGPGWPGVSGVWPDTGHPPGAQVGWWGAILPLQSLWQGGPG